MRILLADDHAIVRSGLRRIVADAYPGAQIDEVGNCADLHDRVARAPWTLLVLDVALGDQNSLEHVPALKERRPGMAILVLSMYEDSAFVLRALRSGVLGYLTKDRAPEELLRAIRTVLEGRRYIGEALASRLADRIALAGTAQEPLHERLSARELEVLRRLGSGLTASEAAARMHVSVKTVSTYRTRILAKLGLETTAQLMRYALQHGLVD